MAYIHFGNANFGKVESVERTSIVTQFFMINYVPIYPIESFYMVHTLRPRGIFRLQRETESHGIALAQRHRRSIVTAYVRGFATVLAVLGVFVLAMFAATAGVLPLGAIGQILLATAAGMFCVGIAVAVGSYRLLGKASPRDITIRTAAWHVLNVAVDPALVKPGFATAFGDSATGMLQSRGVADLRSAGAGVGRYPTDVLEMILVRVRAELANATDSDACERMTDQLVDLLDARSDDARDKSEPRV